MPVDPLVGLGARLSKIRREQRISQKELARITGISIRSISRIETAQTNPTFIILLDLINALHVSADRLFFDDAPASNRETAPLERLYYSCNETGKGLILSSAVMIAKAESDESDK